MPQFHAHVGKYLQHYCEPEARLLRGLPTVRRYRHALVVPAYNETAAFLQNLRETFARASAVLFIVVVNQPDDDDDTRINDELFRWAQASGTQVWRADNAQLLNWSDAGSSLLLVDRFRRGQRLPRRQGVGLARKIGCDLAVQCIALGLLQSTWLHSTDADASLPNDYFSRTNNITGVSAAVFPFIHQLDASPLGRALALYEQSLHYYVDGLRWAGSPYGFHTIGSCLAVDAGSYCQVRGFPRRAGGEDFYLLNKAAKIKPVAQLSGAPIQIALRKSARVPFGTGPAIGKIMTLADPLREYRGYDPRIFLYLKKLLWHFCELWQYRQQPEDWLSGLPKVVSEALAALGFDTFVGHIQKQIVNEQQCVRQIPQWFDGFRTLKFVHYLQQHGFPAVPLNEGVAKLDELRLTGSPTCEGEFK